MASPVGDSNASSGGEQAALPSYRTRLGEIKDAAVNDFREGNKFRQLATGIGVAALQTLDRARASIVVVPTIATHTLEHTHSPLQAAIAGGAAFSAWCAAVGGATTEGLHQYPQTLQAANRNFPGFADFFNNTLPGLEKENGKDKKTNLARRIGRRIITGLKRSPTVAGIGSVAYVSTSAVRGESRKHTHTLNANASLDGGMFVGGVVFGAAEAINKVGESNPELAMDIQNVASNIYLWYGVAALAMAAQGASSGIAKLKARSAEQEPLIPN